MKPIIRIEDLSFAYRQEEGGEDQLALDSVNLNIDKGSFVAVIGRNGSGKSTLAKNINGLLLPTKGAVYVKEMDTSDPDQVWKIRQHAGMVFQNPDNQLVSSIVEDDVAFGPENLGIAPEEIRKRVDESLKSVDMYEERKKAPHLLSGGQKQRIAIAGVVAMLPECIVFDEPTAMLDPKGRKEVMGIIKKLHGQGITVILITHFMEEAAEAERVVIMDQGRIQMDGTPNEIFTQAEKIRDLGLDVPFAVDLATKLRKRGIPVPEDTVEEQGMADFLCRYKSKN